MGFGLSVLNREGEGGGGGGAAPYFTLFGESTPCAVTAPFSREVPQCFEQFRAFPVFQG